MHELQSADNEQFMEKLVNFFNQSGDSALILPDQRFKMKCERKFLLGLDNAEVLLTGDEKYYFIDFIDRLNLNCK